MIKTTLALAALLSFASFALAERTTPTPSPRVHGEGVELTSAKRSYLKDKQGKSCYGCHEQLAPTYKIKTDALAQFHAAGGKEACYWWCISDYDCEPIGCNACDNGQCRYEKPL
jgi:hypothetical protein